MRIRCIISRGPWVNYRHHLVACYDLVCPIPTDMYDRLFQSYVLYNMYMYYRELPWRPVKFPEFEVD